MLGGISSVLHSAKECPDRQRFGMSPAHDFRVRGKAILARLPGIASPNSRLVLLHHVLRPGRAAFSRLVACRQPLIDGRQGFGLGALALDVSCQIAQCLVSLLARNGDCTHTTR